MQEIDCSVQRYGQAETTAVVKGQAIAKACTGRHHGKQRAEGQVGRTEQACRQ